jgi:hypothetical protein
MNRSRYLPITALVGLLASAGVPAATLNLLEIEPNDSAAAAQVLPSLGAATGYRIAGARTFSSALTGVTNSSADYFAFSAQAGSLLRIDVLATASLPSSNRDSLVYLYDSAGAVLAFDDNSGVDLGARIAGFSILAAGNYIVGVTGFGDEGDIDNGGSGVLTGVGGDADFAYTLSIDLSPTVIPLPGSAPLLLLGVAMLAAVRSRAQRRG